MEEFPSGQRGQTVNLLLFSFDGSNPSSSTNENRHVLTCRFLLFIILFIAAFLIYNSTIILNHPYESKYPVTRRDVYVLSYHGDSD